jgi:hypothetical protein
LLFSVTLLSVATTLARVRKGIGERDLLVVLLFITALAMLYAFSNITWIHDFFVVLLLPSVPLAAASIMTRALGGGNRNIVFYIIFLLILVASSYGTYKNIYDWSTNADELVKFMHDHDGRFIFTFDEHPDYQQLRFYTDWKKAVCVRNVGELGGIDVTKFDYIITRADETEAPLASYLESKFGAHARTIYNSYTGQTYTVYFV